VDTHGVKSRSSETETATLTLEKTVDKISMDQDDEDKDNDNDNYNLNTNDDDEILKHDTETKSQDMLSTKNDSSATHKLKSSANHLTRRKRNEIPLIDYSSVQGIGLDSNVVMELMSDGKNNILVDQDNIDGNDDDDDVDTMHYLRKSSRRNDAKEKGSENWRGGFASARARLMATTTTRTNATVNESDNGRKRRSARISAQEESHDQQDRVQDYNSKTRQKKQRVQTP